MVLFHKLIPRLSIWWREAVSRSLHANIRSLQRIRLNKLTPRLRLTTHQHREHVIDFDRSE